LSVIPLQNVGSLSDRVCDYHNIARYRIVYQRWTNFSFVGQYCGNDTVVVSLDSLLNNATGLTNQTIQTSYVLLYYSLEVPGAALSTANTISILIEQTDIVDAALFIVASWGGNSNKMKRW
jgi:hypothetical protein